MPAYRFYIDSPFEEGSHVLFDKNERHHIFKVMRLSPGHEIEAVNGKGYLAHGTLSSEGGLLIHTVHFQEKEPERIIVQAMVRTSKLDWIVEKGTELSMTQLLIFKADRSEKDALSASQLQRLEQLAISAMKQSGRLYTPSIVCIEPILRWKKLEHPTVFGSLDPTAPWLRGSGSEPIQVVIGPEGGLSAKELNHLVKLGAYGIKLHNHILRTETASLTALSLLGLPAEA
jgi:16S rRNA (uracil1498-N3)-methyltransferase